MSINLCLYKNDIRLFFLQLWEESQISNSCLREDLAKVRDELTATRKKLESSMQVSQILSKQAKKLCKCKLMIIVLPYDLQVLQEIVC